MSLVLVPFTFEQALPANKSSAKLYEIGAGTTEIRKMVIGRVSSARIESPPEYRC